MVVYLLMRSLLFALIFFHFFYFRLRLRLRLRLLIEQSWYFFQRMIEQTSDSFDIWTIHLQDESHDYIKRQQLRELAMLNSSFREESPGPGGSVSPFNSSGMKRAKTGR